MVTMRAARLGREDSDDDVRPESSDDAHDVAQYRVLVPDAEGLEIVLGKTEVERAREELASAVDPARREQLLCARDSEFIAELGSEKVLAAVAARDGQVRRAHIASPR